MQESDGNSEMKKKMPFTEIIKAREIRLKIKRSTQGQTDATLLQKIYYWSHQFMPPWLVRDLPQEVRESSFTWHTTCDIPYFRCPAQNFSFSDISSPLPPLFLYFFHFFISGCVFFPRQFLTPNRKLFRNIIFW